MKKRVSSSNLALRFYKSDGWTRECLEKYLIKGSLKDTAETHQYEDHNSYYILDVYAKLNMKNLYENEVGEVCRAFNDYPNETDLQFMERYNW